MVLLKNSKFVGVYMPPQIYSYLALHAVSCGQGKATVIRDKCMEDWYQKQRKNITEDDMIDAIAEAAFQQWNAVSTHGNIFNEYCEDLGQKLLDKGIREVDVTLIIKKLNEKNNEQ